MLTSIILFMCSLICYFAYAPSRIRIGTKSTVRPGTDCRTEQGHTVSSISTIVIVGEVWGADGLTVVNAVCQRNIMHSGPAIPLVWYIIAIGVNMSKATIPSWKWVFWSFLCNVIMECHAQTWVIRGFLDLRDTNVAMSTTGRFYTSVLDPPLTHPAAQIISAAIVTRSFGLATLIPTIRI